MKTYKCKHATRMSRDEKYACALGAMGGICPWQRYCITCGGYYILTKNAEGCRAPELKEKGEL
jgi:hypothetical protein